MNNESQFVVLGRLDKAGIACSGACAIHCLLLPIIAFAAPTISTFLENELIHIILLISLIPIALISFSKSHKVHKNSNPLRLGIIGITLLVASFALEFFHIEMDSMNKVFTGLGSLLLILGHYFNMTYLKKC